MTSEDYWKEKYKDSWRATSEKEKKIKDIIEHECHCICDFCGLGSGETGYIAGSAEKNGYKRGGSYLRIRGTALFIEVTGPNLDSVGKGYDLWVRPDKIENIINNPTNEYWIVHVLKRDFYIRVIQADNVFKSDFLNGTFRVITPIIRGYKERYVAVPPEYRTISDITALFVAVRKAMSPKGD